MLGRPLNTERRRHLPSSKILVDSYSQGYESPVFEIQDVPLFLQLFGANSSNVARVYTVLNGIEQPFIVDESIVALNSVNPTYTLRLSGRYKVKLEGDIGPFVTATKQLVGLDRNREVSQPSGVQANLPNLFLDGQTLSPVIEVQQDPWLFTVYGLVGIDEVLVYSVYGQGATYAQTQLTSNGQPVKLTTANTSIVINKSGRYRFELIGNPTGVKLVGNPTLVDTTIASGESGGGVTYVGLSVPVGFTVSGSPVTSAGQIDIDFDAGYTAYTTIEQTKLATIQTGAEVNVNADWNAASGDAQILNKPVLGTMAAENAADYTPTSGFGSAAFQPSSAFATAAQGALANTALQPGDNVSELLNDAAYVDASGASAAAPVQSVNGETGAVSLDATDVGADASGTAASTMAAHLAASDPHPQYLTGAEGDAAYDALGSAAAAQAAAESYADGKVIDSIADSDTTHAPSRNAVYDAIRNAGIFGTGNPPEPADFNTAVGVQSPIRMGRWTNVTANRPPIATFGAFATIPYDTDDGAQFAFGLTSVGVQYRNTSGGVLGSWHTFGLLDQAQTWTATQTFSNVPSFPSQTAKTVFSAPNGSSGVPTFRQLQTSDLSNAASGPWTPTVTAVDNVTSISAVFGRYMQVGSSVSVSGQFIVVPTTNSGITSVRISLPFAAALSNIAAAAGTAYISNSSTGAFVASGSVRADSTNDELHLQFETTSAASCVVRYVAQYTAS